MAKAKNKTVLVNFRVHTSKRALFGKYGIPYRRVDSFPNNIIPDTIFRSEAVYSFE